MSNRRAFAVFAGVVLLCGVCGTNKAMAQAAEAKQTAKPVPKALLADDELQLYYSGKVACGIAALYSACAIIGQPATIQEIVDSVEVGPLGTRLDEMCAFLEAQGVDFEVVDGEGLDVFLKHCRAGKHAAIVHTDKETHYVTVAVNRCGSLVMIDGTEVRTHDVDKELWRRFSGVAVVAGENPQGLIQTGHWIAIVIKAAVALVLGLVVGFMGSMAWGRMGRSITCSPR